VKPVPPFTEEHEALRAQMRAFVATELRPHAPEWEAARFFPNEVFAKLAARGWLGLKYGADADWVADAVLSEELARCGSGGLAAGIGAHNGIATPPLATFGTAAQQERWLAPAIRGEKIAALAITEPDTGSDVASIRTRAEKVDGGWVVNGAKTFITNGVRADFYVTAVRTRPEPGHGGLSFLVIEAGEGVRASPLEKLGWHASDTAEIAFEDVAVPDGALLGEEGRGFYLIVANFQWERLLMSLGAVGSMRATLERVVAILAEGGVSQSVRHRVAEQAVAAEAGAAMTYQALRRFLDGGDAVREVTMAKLLTQRANFDLQDDCYGMLADLGHPAAEDLARAARDARLGPIGGGTDEIMKEILGKTLGL
jgi:acyl-CoA dehydrogenase